MRDDLLMQRLRLLNYPKPIDVEASVMERVRYAAPASSTPIFPPTWRRVAAAVAVVAVCCVCLNALLLSLRSFNDSAMAQDMASLYSFCTTATEYDFGAIEAYVEIDI